MENGLRIWDDVCQTDPNHTKQVSFGRKFTAIDAMHQIRNVTEYFGPVGLGWSYKTEFGFQEVSSDKVQNTLVWCDVTIHWIVSDDEGKPLGLATELSGTFGPVRGMSPLITGKGLDKIDDDAAKKAMTDGLTKALSHLGFNADVFLGLFDDNRYVQQQEQRVAAESKSQTYVKIMEKTKANDPAGVEEIWTELTEDEIRSLWRELNSYDKGQIRAQLAAARSARGEDPEQNTPEDPK